MESPEKNNQANNHKKENLHTERLEKFYKTGAISANVLRHDNLLREVHLEDEGGVSRTYALTVFLKKQNWNEEIQQIDREIAAGGSIGKTFKSHGYTINKRIVGWTTVDLPDWLRNKFQTEENRAKAKIYDFFVEREGSEPVLYGTITEIYPPEFESPIISDIEKEESEKHTDIITDIENVLKECFDGKK